MEPSEAQSEYGVELQAITAQSAKREAERIQDKLTLGPIDKYQQYNRFPYKLILHVALVIFTSMQVSYHVSNNSLNNNDQSQAWQYFVFGYNSDNNIYQYNQLGGIQSQLINFFNNLNSPNDTIQQVIVDAQTDCVLECYYTFPIALIGQSSHGNRLSFTININDGINGKPFDMRNSTSLKLFLQEVEQFDLVLSNIKLLNNHQSTTCWNLHVQYRLVAQTSISAQLFLLGTYCDIPEQQPSFTKQGSKNKEENDSFGGSVANNAWINFAVIVFALLSILLSVRYIYEIITVYHKTRIQNISKLARAATAGQRQAQQPEHSSLNLSYLRSASYVVQQPNPSISVIPGYSFYQPPATIQQQRQSQKIGEASVVQDLLTQQKSWIDLSFREKMSFFDLWFMYSLVGNMLQTITSVTLIIGLSSISENANPQQSNIIRWGLGLSCFFAWTTIVKYLEYYDRFSIILAMIQRAFPRIMIEAVGFIPILVIYIVIGMCYFSQSKLFSNAHIALTTLFSLVLGDSINKITVILVANSFSQFFSIVYCFSFCMLFMLAVHNIWIAIMSEELQKKTNQVNRRKRVRRAILRYRQELEYDESPYNIKQKHQTSVQLSDSLEIRWKEIEERLVHSRVQGLSMQEQIAHEVEEARQYAQFKADEDHSSGKQRATVHENRATSSSHRGEDMLDRDNLDDIMLNDEKSVINNRDLGRQSPDEQENYPSHTQSVYIVNEGKQLQEGEEEQKDSVVEKMFYDQSIKDDFQERPPQESTDSEHLAAQLLGQASLEEQRQQIPKDNIHSTDSESQRALRARQIQLGQQKIAQRKLLLTFQSVARIVANEHERSQHPQQQQQQQGLLDQYGQTQPISAARQLESEETRIRQQLLLEQNRKETMLLLENRIMAIFSDIKVKINESKKEIRQYSSSLFGFTAQEKQEIWHSYRKMLRALNKQIQILEAKLRQGEKTNV